VKYGTPILFMTALLVGASCGGDETKSERVEAEPSVIPTSTMTVVPELVTNGWIQLGELSFDLEFTCYSPGAGDVTAIGIGKHPDNGQWVEALIQGFLGQPYVGLTIGESVRYEASLDSPLEVFVHDGTISAGAIEWVRGLDLDSGVGERVGYGAVFVSCSEYVHDLPEDY
tara:strand:+ start:363 stop:875 length:513 start_codon:yes stop_codon:yes gene_type:complete